MKRGIEKIHKMGQHITLYVEFYIVPMESELYDHKPHAIYWRVYDSNQNRDFEYSNEYYFYMCPGTEWADHLAEMVARLIRETGCDGVRLDSCSAHFIPCYNKRHHHASPYDYNKWVYELLEKVARAARAVNPDIHLSTEFAVDYFSVHFNSALSPIWGLNWVKDGPAPMAVALPHYRMISYNAGNGGTSAVAQAAYCLPNDTSPFIPWVEARHAVEKAYHYGKLMDDTCVDGEDVIVRHFHLDNEDLFTIVHPDESKTDPNESYLPTKELQTDAEIRCKLGYVPKEAYLINVLDGTVEKADFSCEDGVFRASCHVPFAFILVRREVGDAPIQISAEVLGDGEFELTVQTPSDAVTSPIPATCSIPGLFEYDGYDNIEMTVPGKLRLSFPEGCYAGKYRVNIQGEGIVSSLKILNVEHSK